MVEQCLPDTNTLEDQYMYTNQTKTLDKTMDKTNDKTLDIYIYKKGHIPYMYTVDISRVWFDKSKKSWKMVSGRGSRGQSPLNLLDV